jgi:hypothetical protein
MDRHRPFQGGSTSMNCRNRLTINKSPVQADLFFLRHACRLGLLENFSEKGPEAATMVARIISIPVLPTCV